MQKKRLFSLQRSQNAITALFGFLAFFVICGVFMFGVVPVFATGNLANQTFTGTGIGTSSLASIIVGLLRIFFAILGVLAVFLMIYAGYIWMTAAGDAEKVVKAKQIMLNAVIGLIIIFSAFAIATFILRLLGGVTGGGTGASDRIPGGIGDWGRSAIGAGPIQSVYPAPNQANVPINTRIVVTFKNDVVAETICAGATGGLCAGGAMTANVNICELSATSSVCKTDGVFKESDFVSTTVSSIDAKTFVFTTNKYLGDTDNIDRLFRVSLKEGIKRTSDNKSVFVDLRVPSYDWSFKTNGKLDLTPPEVSKYEIYPSPDGITATDAGDTFTEVASASAGSAIITLGSIVAEKPYRIQGVAYSGQPLTNVKLTTTTATVVSLSFNSDNTFAVHTTVDKTYTFTVNSVGTQIEMAGNTTIGAVLGISNTYLKSCGNNKCLDIVNGNRINTGAGFYLLADGQLVSGRGYTLTITAPQAGNVLTLNNGSSTSNFVFYDRPTASQTEIIKTTTTAGVAVSTKYYVVAASSTSAGNITNLTDVLNNKAGNLISAVASTTTGVIVTAKATGANSLSLTGTGSIGVTGNLSGVSRTTNWYVNGSKDAYNNSTFRVTFTKPINPLDIDSFVKIKIGNGGFVDAKNIASTTVTNQYRTVEFVGRNQCGVNACGKPIYCWLPANATGAITVPVEIKVTASTLKSCGGATATWCSAFGGVCETNGQNRCKLASTGLFYPQAAAVPDGISDLSGNSLNGNFNKASTTDNFLVGNAEGKTGTGSGQSGFALPYWLNSTYDPSQTPPKYTYNPSNTTGDDFSWKFNLSNQIDLTAPLIGIIEPNGSTNVTNFSDPIKISFGTGTLMRSSTIKPGWGYATSTTNSDWFTRFLVLKTLTANANPVGYWATASDIDVDGDGQADYTKVNVNHNPFDQSVNYGPLVGSGLESITQNCFLPGAGPKTGAIACSYLPNQSSTTGCVTDSVLGISQVKPTNPSSYSTLNCNQIDGASSCSSSCKDFTGIKEGSWIITSSTPTATPDGKTGCCLGKCQ